VERGGHFEQELDEVSGFTSDAVSQYSGTDRPCAASADAYPLWIDSSAIPISVYYVQIAIFSKAP
jgi:hypothetical protein